MATRSKLLLVALTAALVMAMAAGSSSASRGVELSVASGSLGAVETVSRALTFTDPGGTARIVCEVTLRLSLHRSIAKSAGALVGLVNDARVAEARCTGGGRARVLFDARRPWHVTYVSFSGTLPNITSVRLQLNGAAFLIEAFIGIARCLYTGNAQGTTVGGTTVTGIRADESVALPLSATLGAEVCPATGIFAGELRVTPNVRLRLLA